MIFFRITDFMIVMSVLNDETIKKEIYEDGAIQMIPDVINDIWIGVSTEKDMIGCYHLQKRSSCLWEFHIRLLPKFRKKYSWEATRGFLKWIEQNIVGIETLIGFVPDPFRYASIYLRKLGFTQDGYLKNAFRRNDELVGVKMYSISMDQIRGQICQP